MSRTLDIAVESFASSVIRSLAAMGRRIADGIQSLPAEHRRYLLPLGADSDHLLLEDARISYESVAFGFPDAIPAFNLGHALPPALQQASTDELVFTGLTAHARLAGFRAERRALPPAANVLVFDLSPAADTEEQVISQARKPRS